jgi:hypothetical protein
LVKDVEILHEGSDDSVEYVHFLRIFL